MTSFPPDADIQDFWAWVQTIADELAEDLENGAIIETLNRRVSRLGDISWEVGPGRHAENALTLTPDGDPAKLAVTKHIITFAPSVAGWEFYPAKPAKDWNLMFSIETENGDIVDVDARTWRYVLFRFPDDTFDLILSQDGLAPVGEDDRYTAAVIVVDGLLGEEVRMALIDTIEPVEALSKKDEPQATSILALPQHLESLSV
jgi:hypothetical protein